MDGWCPLTKLLQKVDFIVKLATVFLKHMHGFLWHEFLRLRWKTGSIMQVFLLKLPRDTPKGSTHFFVGSTETSILYRAVQQIFRLLSK